MPAIHEQPRTLDSMIVSKRPGALVTPPRQIAHRPSGARPAASAFTQRSRHRNYYYYYYYYYRP